MATLFQCKNCRKEFDLDSRIPLVAACGHNICKTCYANGIGDICLVCGEPTFRNQPARNYLAAGLLDELQEVKNLIDELIGENSHIQKAKVNIDKPESSRAWKEREGSAEHRPKSKHIVIKNVNPKWSMPDINESFNVYGKIIKSFSHRNREGQLTSAEINYEDFEGAQGAVECMHGTDNGCGGLLHVNFKNPYIKNNKPRERPFKPERTIRVEPLGLHITENDLKRVFSEHGTIKACRKSSDKWGNPTGVALIEYDNEFNALTAVRSKQNYRFPDTDVKLIVEPYNPLP